MGVFRGIENLETVQGSYFEGCLSSPKLLENIQYCVVMHVTSKNEKVNLCRAAASAYSNGASASRSQGSFG